MKRIIFAIVSISIILLCSINYFGFCFSEMSFFDDEKRVYAAIEQVLSSYPPPIIKDRIKSESGLIIHSLSSPKLPIRYLSVSDFLKENPFCCNVVLRRSLEESPPTFSEKISGRVNSFIEIEYAVNYIDGYGNRKKKIVKTSFPVSNCGCFVKNRI